MPAAAHAPPAGAPAGSDCVMEVPVNRPRRLTHLTNGLGIASIVALGFSHLALTDIGHGEGDLTLEWTILRIAALVLIAFILSTFASLRALSRS